ncbi:hypothetical protein CRENBAI_012980 [Crenichthys baileyi]|uniref:Uncharacterized protein n=1 Tax=Crenichthys baileyi TaxID=28760 RepID=A0AAV9QR50_9TELE
MFCRWQIKSEYVLSILLKNLISRFTASLLQVYSFNISALNFSLLEDKSAADPCFARLPPCCGPFSSKRAPFCAHGRAADAAPRPGHVTKRSGLSSPPFSVLPSQGSMSAVWPHPVSLQRRLPLQCSLLFSEEEKGRK